MPNSYFTEQLSRFASEYTNKYNSKYFAVCQTKEKYKNEHARTKRNKI